ncbi:MAG: hypothetical protein LBR96_02740 [Treponema sp.]|nr:hypothetical protein [Treponema sp.]
MKKRLILMGVLGMLLAFALIMAGCDTGTNSGDDNPFVGDWSGTASVGGGNASATIKVTDSGWSFLCPDAKLDKSGTYTYSGSTATLKEGSLTFGTATVSGSTLNVKITGGDYEGGTGTFTK